MVAGELYEEWRNLSCTPDPHQSSDNGWKLPKNSILHRASNLSRMAINFLARKGDVYLEFPKPRCAGSLD